MRSRRAQWVTADKDSGTVLARSKPNPALPAEKLDPPSIAVRVMTGSSLARRRAHLLVRRAPNGYEFDMPRLSDKHSPRVHDQLEHETQPVTRGSGVESHSREDLRHEPPADDELMADPARRPDVPMRDGINPDLADARAEFARHVAPARFPAAGPTS
jgi:hypothetical protein